MVSSRFRPWRRTSGPTVQVDDVSREARLRQFRRWCGCGSSFRKQVETLALQERNLFTSRWETSIKDWAVSRMWVTTSRGSPSIDASGPVRRGR